LALKREIVEATLAAGASVSRVARVYDVNANQVFCWRRKYQRGLLEAAEGKQALLPVRITDEARAIAYGSRSAGSIEVEMARGRMRLEGAPDPVTLRLVLEQLRG
jgi:transposase